MHHPPHPRPPLVRSLDRALIAIGLAGLIIGLFELSVLPLDGPAAELLLALPLVFWSYLFAGLLAWHRRPSNPFGALTLWVGVAVFLGGIANVEAPALQAVGAVTVTLALAAVLHLLLAFPSGRLRCRPTRLLVAFAYAFSFVLAAPAYLFDSEGRFPPFAVADLPGMVAASRTLEIWCGLVVVLATVVILVLRLRHADRRHRRVLIPLYSYGILAIVFIPFSSVVLTGMLGMDPLMRGALQFIVIGALPIAFTFGLLRGGFARTGGLVELGSWLGSAGADRRELRSALADTLGDPSLALLFWSAERGEFIDHAGAPVGSPALNVDGSGGRGWQEIHVDGRRTGAIDYDAALLTDSALVRTAGNVIAIALERERLTAELLASSRELVRSRERLVDGADRERRRVARDLHDGLQAQLVLLALDAQRLAATADAGSHVRAGATHLRQDIDGAARVLRDLVHRLMPPGLVEKGLAAAAEDLADRMPIPTRIDSELPEGRLPAPVENAAYFVIAEALTNVVKHAHANTATIRLRQQDGLLHVEVRDDGVGNARTADGTGLRGLEDRVETLGGATHLISESGAGTSVRVELPCG